MPSTYTVNLGIEKPATGEQSGTWGDTTNVNFDIIDQAVNGSERVTLTSAGTSGSPNDLNIVNGSTTSSEGRNKWIEIYSASDLGGSAYVRLVPNDAEKILFIRNSLAGSQSVLLFQGTYNASNDLEIPAGVDMVVRFDGAGASATVTDVFTKLRAAEITTPTLTAGTADINGGSVDGATVGAASASTGAFTTLTASTSLNIAASTTVDGILDEDNMASDSATKLATQQSIKAYVDSQVGTVDTLAEILANGNTSGANNLIIDNGQALTSNTINETTAGSGVTIDSVLLKDDGVNATNLEITNIKANDGTAAATIANSTGNFTITNFISNSVDIGGGAIDGTVIGGSTAAAITGTTITGTSFVSSGDMTFGDNDKAIFGAGSDLQIYHSGSQNYIEDAGTGNLNFKSNGNNFNFLDGSDNVVMQIDIDSATTLYHNTSAKLATTSTGIDVTGTVTATGTSVFASLDISGDIDVDGTTNLDVVDIDDTLNVAGVSTFTAAINQTTESPSINLTDSSSSRTLSVNVDDNNSFLRASGPMLLQSGGAITTISLDASQNMALTGNLSTTGGAIFNEGGVDADFRVESDTNANGLMLDASTSTVGVNRAASAGVGLSVNATATNSSTYALEACNSSSNTKFIVRSDGYSGFYKSSNAGGFIHNTDGAITITPDAGGHFVFNEDGADADFRVESDTNTHALFVDAGNNVIGTGTSSPATYVGTGGLAVKGSTVSDLSLVSGGIASGNNSHQMRYWNDTGTAYEIARTRVNVGAGQVNRGEYQFAVNNGGGLRQWLDVDYQGNVTFNEGGNDSDFRVESDNNANMLFVDGGNDRVGVNTSAPETYVDFAVPTVQIRSDATGANEPKLIFNNDLFAGANHGFIQTTNGGLQLDFESGSSSTFTGRAKMQLIGGGGRSIRFYTSTDNGSSFVERLEISNADIIANETGADQDFRVESDGNANMLFVDGGNNRVGIGTSAPTTFLDVGGIGSSVNSSFNGIAITASAAFTGVTGNVGLYLSASNSGGSLNGFFRTKAGAGGTYDGVEIATDNRPFRILTSTTEDTNERLRITSSGDFLVGTTVNYPGVSGLGGNIQGMMSEGGGSFFLSRVDSNPVLYINRGGTDGDSVRFAKDAGSTVGSISVTATTTAYNTSSDERLKENITDANDAGDKIDAIKVRQYDWKANGSHQDYGMVAQELLEVAPEAVAAPEDPEEMMGVDYSKLVPMLIKEIQSLRARVADLEP